MVKLFIQCQAFNKMSNPNKADKLKTLVKDLESSPDVRDKVKIAFAEGYMASNKGDAQAASGAWVKRLGKIFWYALICWLLLQLVQVYFPLGGSELIVWFYLYGDTSVYGESIC